MAFVVAFNVALSESAIRGLTAASGRRDGYREAFFSYRGIAPADAQGLVAVAAAKPILQPPARIPPSHVLWVSSHRGQPFGDFQPRPCTHASFDCIPAEGRERLAASGGSDGPDARSDRVGFCQSKVKFCRTPPRCRQVVEPTRRQSGLAIFRTGIAGRCASAVTFFGSMTTKPPSPQAGSPGRLRLV